ncbi:MAG TPA: pyroglutamyl-peptidase I [Arthrobacter sp.]|nr:pyroglutamyl-peptidase I [Arthrobacter sp.]
MPTKILLTGFEPFGGQSINPSWQAVQLAAAELTNAGYAVRTIELPCVFGESARILGGALNEERPDLILCVGQAGGRGRLSLERIAINVDDARIPDNAGNSPVDSAVVDGGPAAYFSTLPIKASLRELLRMGVAAEISQSAGTYVCNHVFYALMHELQRGVHSGAKGGFVHIPFAPEQVLDSSVASMEITTAASALAAIVRVGLATGGDIAMAAGATH